MSIEISGLLRICADRSSRKPLPRSRRRADELCSASPGWPRTGAPDRPVRTHRSAAQAFTPDLWSHRHLVGQALPGACPDGGATPAPDRVREDPRMTTSSNGKPCLASPLALLPGPAGDHRRPRMDFAALDAARTPSAQLKAVGAAWGRRSHPDGEPADGFLRYGTEEVPVLGPDESGRSSGGVVRGHAHRRGVRRTWTWLIASRCPRWPVSRRDGRRPRDHQRRRGSSAGQPHCAGAGLRGQSRSLPARLEG